MATDDRGSDSAREVKYRVIAEDLIADIRAGVLAPGEKIPSTHALAERYDVTPATVQSAVMVLKSRRFVEGRQGAGTFVLPKEIWSAGYPLQAVFHVDPAVASTGQAMVRYSFEDEMGKFRSYEELAAQDTDFQDRFLRQLRVFNKLMDMEHGYWQLRKTD